MKHQLPAFILKTLFVVKIINNHLYRWLFSKLSAKKQAAPRLGAAQGVVSCGVNDHRRRRRMDGQTDGIDCEQSLLSS